MANVHHVLDAARQWVQRGYYPVPIPYREKGPKLENWQNLRLTAADVPRYFNGAPQNIGVLQGEPYGHSDIDLDCTQAVTAFPHFAPKTNLIFGHKSKPRSHYFYCCDPPHRSVKYLDPIDRTTLLEFRCLKTDGSPGLQTLVPPSVHPSGEPIEFWRDCNREPANVDADELGRAVRWTAAVSLLSRHWPAAQGGRHDAFLALAGALAHAKWRLDTAAHLVCGLYQTIWPTNADLAAAMREVESTYQRHAGGHEVTGLPNLVKLVPPPVIKAIATWLGLGQVEARAETTDKWPEPLPIGSELPAVDAFDPLLLPEALRAFVEDVATRMQVPLDYPAACLMLTMAGAVSRRARIQPKAKDSSWIVTPNLWGGIIGLSGFMKSPTLNMITAPLHAQETLWRAEYASELESYETQKEELELRLAAWKEQTKASFKGKDKDKPPPLRPDTSITLPVPKRLITCDSTFEKLHVLMQENPAGLLVIRDELTGWWAELDREGRQGERGFFLSAWNGDTPFTIDRVARGSVHVPACCVSMVGGITPGRLRSYLVDALQDGPSNDGLIQRFQVLVWPDPPQTWRYVDEAPATYQVIKEMFERILKWDLDLVTHFRFNAEAQEFFVGWLSELERTIRSEDLHPAMVSHLAKYRKLMPALCLLLSAADQLTTEGCLHDPPLVFLEQAQQAARWCTYLESHAKRVYGCVVTATMQAAADLAAKLKSKAVEVDDKGTFAVRDVYRHHWTNLDTPERARAALDVLEDAGWVRRVQNDPISGRPPDRYTLNPKVQQ